jgi:hypothetical protein
MSEGTIATPDEKLSGLGMPAVSKIASLHIGEGDTLIMCAGFEDRSVGALKKALSSPGAFHVIVITYTPVLDRNQEGLIRSVLASRADVTVTCCSYDRENPAGFGIELASKIGHENHVYIDISGMSRLLIVQTIVAFAGARVGFRNCSILYSEAEQYPPDQAEAQQALAHCTSDPTFSALFLSSGVFEITVVPELSSVSVAPTESRLIVFPGFDVHHLTALRAELQPSQITFIEGDPPDAANKWRREMIAKLNCLEDFTEAERILTSTLDYRQTLLALLTIYRRNVLRERLLVAPTGSKMQTVAVALFRAYITDVQVVYSTSTRICFTRQLYLGVRQHL